jgi:hypothetical protein
MTWPLVCTAIHDLTLGLHSDGAADDLVLQMTWPLVCNR